MERNSTYLNAVIYVNRKKSTFYKADWFSANVEYYSYNKFSHFSSRTEKILNAWSDCCDIFFDIQFYLGQNLNNINNRYNVFINFIKIGRTHCTLRDKCHRMIRFYMSIYSRKPPISNAILPSWFIINFYIMVYLNVLDFMRLIINKIFARNNFLSLIINTWCDTNYFNYMVGTTRLLIIFMWQFFF